MIATHPSGRVGRRSRNEVEALVLYCLRNARVPLGAYEIIERAAAAGSRLIPAQVYRTLGRLVDDHHVSRVESLSGYIAIDGPVDCLSICKVCSRVTGEAAPHLIESLSELGSSAGFCARSTVVEVLGTCSQCLASGTNNSSLSGSPMSLVGGEL